MGYHCWRNDGIPLWHDPNLIADLEQTGSATTADTEAFITAVSEIIFGT